MQDYAFNFRAEDLHYYVNLQMFCFLNLNKLFSNSKYASDKGVTFQCRCRPMEKKNRLWVDPTRKLERLALTYVAKPVGGLSVGPFVKQCFQYCALHPKPINRVWLWSDRKYSFALRQATITATMDAVNAFNTEVKFSVSFSRQIATMLTLTRTSFDLKRLLLIDTAFMAIFFFLNDGRRKLSCAVYIQFKVRIASSCLSSRPFAKQLETPISRHVCYGEACHFGFNSAQWLFQKVHLIYFADYLFYYVIVLPF